MKFLYIKIGSIFLAYTVFLPAGGTLSPEAAKTKLIDSLLTKAESLVSSNSAESIVAAEEAGQLAEGADNISETAGPFLSREAPTENWAAIVFRAKNSNGH